MKWLLLAYKNVMRNRRRAFASILITTVGTVGILVGGGFSLYSYESLRESAARGSGHIVLAKQGHFTKAKEKPLQYGLENYQDIITSLEQDERVRYVLPKLGFSGLITNGEISSVFIGNGIDPRGEFVVKGPFFKVLEGNVLSSYPEEGEIQIIIGDGLAQLLNAHIGDSLTLLSSTIDGALNALDAQVHGIFRMGVPEIDKRLLFIALPEAQELLQTQKISTLSIYLRNTEDTPAVSAHLQQKMPDLVQKPWWESASYYHAVRNLYNRIFGMLGIIIIAMVFFSISNTLSMSVVERTREIGTLRAMGAYPGELIRNFMLEALVISMVGVMLGILISASISIGVLLADLQMPPPPARSVSYPLAIYIDPILYAVTALTLLSLSVMAAWFASRRVVKKPIVETLAHV